MDIKRIYADRDGKSFKKLKELVIHDTGKVAPLTKENIIDLELHNCMDHFGIYDQNNLLASATIASLNKEETLSLSSKYLTLAELNF